MSMQTSSTTISIGTDVATLVLFHPEDLAHRECDPIAWYSYGFVWRKESREGRLVAFGTGSDGGYAVRLTTGSLAPDEAARACSSWEFPLIVRHGRVLLDNTDALPGEEQMTKPSEIEDQWFDLANGSYKVTVHPISFEQGSSLPDYVIRFEPIPNIATIPIADTPPTLKPLPDWTPPGPPVTDSELQFEWPRKSPNAGEFAILPVDSNVSLLPGVSATVSVSEEVGAAIFPKQADGIRHLVVSPVFRPGDLAMLARPSGLSRMGNREPRLSVSGMYPVRIVRAADPQPLRSVTVVPIEKPDLSEPNIAAFRDRLLQYARQNAEFRERLIHDSFEIERLEALSSAEAVTGWALQYLPLSWTNRLACYATSAVDRIATLEHFLQTGSDAE